MIEPYYSEDGITLYCAKCEDVLPQLQADVVITDPPYGVGYEYGEYVDTPENFERTILQTVRWCAENIPTAVNMSMRQMWKLPPAKWVLCWYKPGSTRRNAVGGFSIWEPIFLYGKGWRVANDAIRLPDVTNHSAGNKHPCPKPLKLVSWIMNQHGGETVLDPFAGSGTTLLAAKRFGRKAIGIEMSEDYCRIIVERLGQREMIFD